MVMMKSNERTCGLVQVWVVLILGLVLSLPAMARHNGLAGTWEVAGTPDPSSMVDPFVNLARISRDGSIVNVDPTEGAAVGEWRRVGPRTYTVTFYGFFPGNLRFKVEGLVELSHGGNRFSGPFVTELSDSSGNVVFSFGGEVDASRL
jgi:hypothetical protein